jgi:short-subunit dehydrogenase
MFITTPDKAAKTILNGVKKNKRRVLIGPDAHFLDIMVRLLPTSYQWIFTKVVGLQKKMNTKAA